MRDRFWVMLISAWFAVAMLPAALFLTATLTGL